MLVISDLQVALAGRPVLRGVSLTARPGQVTAVCGPNGAGKSTLLRACLAETPFSGGITLNGLDPRRTPSGTMARLRAVLPQDTEVAFGFTVAEVVAMGQGAGDFAHRPALVGEALATVGLQALAGRDFQTLSGGERQRAHLARALTQVWEPTCPDGARWLLLDEPVAAMDLGHQLLVMQIARRFADDGGGVVMVMHDLNLTAKVSDRICLLVDGRLAAAGQPAEVLTAEHLERAFDCRVRMRTPPAEGPWFVPQSCALRP